jgi:hypothetical protein
MVLCMTYAFARPNFLLCEIRIGWGISMTGKGKRGAAIIEIALTLPILVLICLATIDTCKVIFVKQSAKIAAFECARIGILPGVTKAQIARLCDTLMTRRNVNGAVMSLSVDELSALSKGDLLTVTVAVPANSNALSSSWFYRGRTFSETVSILVEQ